MGTAVTLILFCCVLVTVVAGQCDVSAPETTLHDIASECDHEDKGRKAYCVAAMHRFCGQVKYPQQHISRLGVSQEAANGAIAMACVRAEWSGIVTINTLKQYNSGCSKVGKSQHRDCLSAIHQYCRDHHHPSDAGISQEEGDDVLGVYCFKSSKMETVSNDVLKHKHPGCTYKKSDSAACFAAASRWCQLLRHSGGITQEADSKKGITVACYKADFANTVFVKRTDAFYVAQQHIAKLCNIEFDIERGEATDIAPEYVKVEVYDNTGSNATTLQEQFTVAKDITDTYSFTHTESYQISKEFTFTAKLPYFDSSLKISTTSSTGVSFTKGSTVTHHYTHTSTVEVPPKKKVVKNAFLKRASLDIPWSGKILNGLGATIDLSGSWSGVTSYSLEVNQTEHTTGYLHLQYYDRGQSLTQGPINADLGDQQKIVKIEFDIDEGKILEVATEYIKVEIFDDTLQDEFTISKDVTDISYFTHTQSYEIDEELTFTAQLPYVDNTGTLSISPTYSNGLSLTKKNTATTHYHKIVPVSVPPGRKFVLMALLTKANLEVPWSGKLWNALGAEQDISGTWSGVSTYNFRVEQEDNPKDYLQLQYYSWGQSLTQGPINEALDTQESSPASTCSNNLALCPSNSALCSSILATSPINSQCACAMADCSKGMHMQMPSSESCKCAC